jgi:hypothetical protein
MAKRAWIPAAIAIALAAAAIAGLLALRAPTPPALARALPRATKSAARAGAAITPEETSVADDDAFRLLVFPVRLAGARFDVIDVGMKTDLDRVLADTGASLVVNGGFFDEAERPEGLVVVAGETISPRSDTLGGGVIAVTGGRASLAKAEAYSLAPGTDFAIQARPRLVVDGESVIVKDNGQIAERTALCARDGGRELEVIVARGEHPGRGPTLALLADMLVSRGCTSALNLDGGPSTGAAWRDASGTHTLAPRGSIRHAIAIWAPRDER